MPIASVSVHRLTCCTLAVFAAFVALAPAPAAAQNIDVLSIANSRFLSGWTLDGTFMSNTRAKLLNTDYFGAAGNVLRPIVIEDTAATITPALLAGVEIVFIGYLYDESANAFSNSELNALYDFVAAGGSILVTCDDPAYDAVCSRFGFPIVDYGGYLQSASGAGFNHPALVGPFGAARQVAGDGTIGNFSDIVDATVLLRGDIFGRPIALADTVGSGRVIALGDVDLISDDSVSIGSGNSLPNDALLFNLFAWLAGESGGSCVPDDTTLCIDNVPGDGRFRVRVTYDTVLGGGLSGNALASSTLGMGAPTGGLFTFFDPKVPEMLLKVLNGCGSTGYYWIFFSAGTNAGFTVTVTDLIGGGAPWTYTNPDLQAAPPVQDIYALPCI
jgi:hypothetical protein